MSNNQLCKCGKVGAISCPNDERCGKPNNQLPAEVQERIKADAKKAYPVSWQYQERIGYIAGATAEHERAQEEIQQLKLELKQKTKALERFVSMHETGLLPNRFVYDNAKEILQQWKEGKEVGDDNK